MRDLDRRLALSGLVADVCGRFAELGTADIGLGIDEALGRLLEVSGGTRVALVDLSPDRKSFWVSHRRVAPGIEPLYALHAATPLEPLAYVRSQLTSRTAIVLSDETLPGDACNERELIRHADGGRLVIVPLLIGSGLLGMMTYQSFEKPDASLLEALSSVARLFASARDRERADALLMERLRFEETLAESSTRLMTSTDLDGSVHRVLAEFGRILQFDRIGIFTSADPRVLRMTHEWRDSGVTPLASICSEWSIERFPWPLEDVRDGRAIVFGPEDAPPEAVEARDALHHISARVIATVPLVVDGEVLGCIAFQRTRSASRPNEQQLGRLRLIGELLGGTLARRDARASLRSSRADFYDVVQSALDGFALVDQAGNVLEWTPEAARIFGWQRAEMVGSHFGEVLALGQDGGNPQALLARAERRPGKRLEVTSRTRDDREIVVELSMSLLNSGGDPRFGVFIRDITDMKRAEAARRTAFDEISRLKTQIEGERDYLREAVHAEHALETMVCKSPAMQRVMELVGNVAATSATALIIGESGVGKELVARAIHAASARADRPLVKVNCASIPKELFESEFFGHLRGAFTGAHRDRAGRFEVADKGTLLLDEVGEIPLDLQAKLLRVLQEGEFERVGDDRTRKVDVRLIAATNRDLGAEVSAGRFRADLYYRLSVFPIEVPPLRDRKQDIVPLAKRFLEAQGRATGRRDLVLDERDCVLLEGYAWPGNVRELSHVIERATILSTSKPLCLEAALQVNAPPSPSCASDELLTVPKLRELERANTLRALERCSWRISGPNGAAVMLGVNASTLRARIAAFDIRKPTV